MTFLLCNTRLKIFILLAGLALALPCATLAADALTSVKPDMHPAPLHFKGIYEFKMAAIKLGKMGIEVEETSDHYAMIADIISTGLVNTLVKHSSHTTVDASGGKNFIYPNKEYESNYQTRKKKKYVKMVHKDGKLVEEKLVPPDNRAIRPAVADALKKDTVDPLSFLLVMREKLYTAMQEKKDRFTLKLYDGRRLTQVDFVIGGKQNILYNGKKVPVVVVDVTRKLLNGFTASELANHDPNEPVLHLYITNDARLIPLRAEFSFWMGSISAVLAKECRTGESCLLGIKE